jgi:hypothetical protein
MWDGNRNTRKSVDSKHTYVGVDHHKPTLNATVMDECENLINVKLGCEPDSLRAFSELL